MPPSTTIENVPLCQLAPLACLHIHPSCYHVPAVDKAAFGQSWSCHHRKVGVQDNHRVVQLLPALSLPTMVCLCWEWSGRVVLAAFKPFLETCDCVSGAQLCCGELTCVTVCLIKGLNEWKNCGQNVPQCILGHPDNFSKHAIWNLHHCACGIGSNCHINQWDVSSSIRHQLFLHTLKMWLQRKVKRNRCCPQTTWWAKCAW